MGEFLSTPNKEKDSHDKETSLLKYGVCGMQGWRKRMEDAHITAINLGDNNKLHIFGVFDGHGGKEVAQYVSKHFAEEFIKSDAYKNKDIKGALKATFIKMDEIMETPEGKEEIKVYARKSKEEDEQNDKKQPQNPQAQMLSMLMGSKNPESDEISMRTGCTACVCVIDEENNKIYFGNAGDSRVVMCSKGTAIPKSTDHKPELEKEKQRIYKADGWIVEGRVKGNLNLTRGLGDLEFKQNKKLTPEEQIITADPDVEVEELNDDVDFIIVGCDGIWDCLTNQEACDFVKERLAKDPNRKLSGIIEEMMDSIVATDINNEKGIGCDNMTCMVILFKHNVTDKTK